MSSRTDKIKAVEQAQLKTGIPNFKVGDTVKVYVKIIEEGKARTQMYEGIVIAKKGTGMGATFGVRKISFGEGVERVFPVNSPSIEKIIIAKRSDVRRSKLYYLRKKIGKATRIEEKIEAKKEEAEPGDALPREEGKEEGA